MLPGRLTLALSLLALFALGVVAQQPPPKRPPEELLRLSLAAEKPGLAEPFTGMTTNGRIESAALFTDILDFRVRVLVILGRNGR